MVVMVVMIVVVVMAVHGSRSLVPSLSYAIPTPKFGWDAITQPLVKLGEALVQVGQQSKSKHSCTQLYS